MSDTDRQNTPNAVGLDGKTMAASASNLGWAAIRRLQVGDVRSKDYSEDDKRVITDDYKSASVAHTVAARAARMPGGADRLVAQYAESRGMTVKELERENARYRAENPIDGKKAGRLERHRTERAEQAQAAASAKQSARQYWQAVVEQGRAQQKDSAMMTQSSVEAQPRRSARLSA